MEMNIAILMADLSGYTALTETHGAVAAADLIDKYIGIVKSCLIGDCHLHERTGDEIMVISSSPDFLLATAVMIGKHTSNEDNFLQVHGGLHYGKVLQRGNSYFGSVINLTSRIASKANAGSVWCSDEFVNALFDKSVFPLKSKGNQVFIIFEDIQEMAHVFMNGKDCGVVWTPPYKVDVTKQLKAGSNHLNVQVINRALLNDDQQRHGRRARPTRHRINVERKPVRQKHKPRRQRRNSPPWISSA